MEEAGSETLEAFLSNYQQRTSSVLTRIEASRAVRRRAFPSDFQARLSGVFARVDFIPIHTGIVQEASRLDPPLLRSLDAIHIASALALGEELEGIVTYDRRLAEAARQLGIPVFSPASDN